MSKNRDNLPEKTVRLLWVLAGGRCHLCNRPLWRENLTQKQVNVSQAAHIYSVKPKWARHDPVKSRQLEKSIDNLMLLCYDHHKLIDDASTRHEFPAEKLLQIKKEHEERIERLTGIAADRRSHVILYGSRIGVHESPLSVTAAHQAMVPQYYPASDRPVQLGMANAAMEDGEELYWQVQLQQLVMQFERQVSPLKVEAAPAHFSLFAMAPQPLLIKLGTLLSDIYPAEVYQLQREPSTWVWQEDDAPIDFSLTCVKKGSGPIGMKLSLSATITNDRLVEVLGADCSIWEITHPQPHNNFLKSRLQLRAFRNIMRHAFDHIKAQHGQKNQLHLFPAMPITTAIELGRVWMPKADLPLIIYDQNKKTPGFGKAITIS